MSIKLKTKNTIYLITAILMVGVFSGCSNKSIENKNQATTAQEEITFSNITPEDAKKRLDSEKEIMILDVRTKEEYETGHIEKSILIPVDTLVEEAEKKLVDKEGIIFVYCRSGNRSNTAANILVEKGYKNIYNLGGIADWPYEIVK